MKRLVLRIVLNTYIKDSKEEKVEEEEEGEIVGGIGSFFQTNEEKVNAIINGEKVYIKDYDYERVAETYCEIIHSMRSRNKIIRLYEETFPGRNDLIDSEHTSFIFDSINKKIVFNQNSENNQDKIGFVQFDPKTLFRNNIGGNSTPILFKEFRKSKRKAIDSFYYFEVKIHHLEGGEDGSDQCMAIGVAPTLYHDKFVGWKENSVGYHSDNGCIYDNFENWNEKKDMSLKFEPYKTGDVIGVGYDKSLTEKNVFFTKNGKKLEYVASRVFKDPITMLFPSITMITRIFQNILFSVNFGEDTVKDPFMFEEFNTRINFSRAKAKKFCDIVIVCEY